MSTTLKSQEKYCSKAHIQYMILVIVVCINNGEGLLLNTILMDFGCAMFKSLIITVLRNNTIITLQTHAVSFVFKHVQLLR